MKKPIILSIAISTLCLMSFTTNSPTVKAVDLANFDTSVKPGDDFYHYVNGNWIKNNPVPDAETRWGSFSIVDELIKDRLRIILTGLTNQGDLVQGSPEQKIRDYYAAAMDTVRIEKEGVGKLAEELKKIDAISDKKEILTYISYMNSMGIRPFFFAFAGQDDKDATQVLMNFFQGGMGLPDKDYYLKDDAESAKIRQQYIQHIDKMLTLAGVSSAKKSTIAAASLPVSADATSPVVQEEDIDNTFTADERQSQGYEIFAIEKRLAKVSKSRVELRDPEANYNKMTVEEFEKSSDGLLVGRYLEGLHQASRVKDLAFKEVIVGQPKFFAALNTLIQNSSLENLKAYLKWNLINNKADMLSSAFVQADFDFYEGTLRGAKEMKPRWKRKLDAVNGSMGELLGQIYVKKYFSPEAKDRVKVMVDNLMLAYRERIMSRTWMDDVTKKAALAKLEKINPKLAYPDKWRDYSMLEINKENSYYDNSNAVARYALWYNLNKIGKPIDKTEWGMSPQTVNAYYNPGYNEIVFPAAIMQPPFFYPDGDDAVNYGAMGAVIGHEITHGFDDQGNQFDADGNLRNWWTDQDKERFRTEADKLVAQYSNFVALDTLKVNGALTQGENIADLGGLTMAYAALQIALKDKKMAKIDGFTPDQRFFISFAQVWRNNIREAELKRRLKVDVHSPGKYRTLGPLANMPEFYKAFNIKPGDKMYNDEKARVEIW
jgi:putative endopeptidase